MATSQKYTERELIELAKLGSLEAWNELYDRYYPTVYRRVSFKVPSVDVEDVIQEVFVAVIKSLTGFRGDAQLKTWIWTLTDRQIVNYYRQRKPEAETLNEEGNDDYQPTFKGDRRPTETDTGYVCEAVRQLPEKYRDILLLRFVDEYQFHEIAQQRGETLEATKSLFRRAVQALRRKLDVDNG